MFPLKYGPPTVVRKRPAILIIICGCTFPLISAAGYLISDHFFLKVKNHAPTMATATAARITGINVNREEEVDSGVTAISGMVVVGVSSSAVSFVSSSVTGRPSLLSSLPSSTSTSLIGIASST